MSNAALPNHLKGKKHTDFPWFLRWVPRAWTSYKLGGPPVLLCGNQKNFYLDDRYPIPYPVVPYPIPDPLLNGGNFTWGIYGVALQPDWAYLPLAFACSWRRGVRRWHVRFPIRWDNVDGYFTVPSFEVSAKKKYD